MHSLTIVGCGPGSKEYATNAAVNAIAEAEIVIGAQRLLDEFACGKTTVPYSTVEDTITCISEHLNNSVAILVTGDPGFYSIASCIRKRFMDLSFKVIPGLSSITYAFTRLCISWQNARFISFHKEIPDSFLQIIEQNQTVGILTSPKYSPSVFATMIDHSLVGSRKIYIGERLSYTDENLRLVTFQELENLKTDPLSVVIIDGTNN